MGGGGELKGYGSSYPVFAERPVGVPKTSILKGRIEPFYKSGQYYKVNLQAYVISALFWRMADELTLAMQEHVQCQVLG
jgi:alpha-mannosidase